MVTDTVTVTVTDTLVVTDTVEAAEPLSVVQYTTPSTSRLFSVLALTSQVRVLGAPERWVLYSPFDNSHTGEYRVVVPPGIYSPEIIRPTLND